MFFSKNIPNSLNDLQSGINRLFEQVWHGGISTGPLDGQECAPCIEMIDKPDRYVIEAELPGLSREDVEVTCTASQLTLKGHKPQTAARDQNDQLLLAERRYGGFSRIILFVEPVKAEEMSAKLDKGVLHIIAPKKTASTPRAVHVPISEV